MGYFEKKHEQVLSVKNNVYSFHDYFSFLNSVQLPGESPNGLHAKMLRSISIKLADFKAELKRSFYT